MRSRRRTPAPSRTPFCLLASVATTLGLLGGCVDESTTPFIPLPDGGTNDAGADATTDARAATDAGPPADAASDAYQGPTGRIEGTVLDFATLEIGVLAGATIATTVGTTTVTTTSDEDGRFALENVPAGVALVRITQATNTALESGAFSSEELPVVVRADATSQLFPRLHRGCQIVSDLVEGSEDKLYLEGICGDRPDSFLSIAYPADAFVADDGSTFTGKLRTEVVPIAFPSSGQRGVTPTSATDLSWSVGLPGTSVGLTKAGSPVGIEGLGGVEIRFVNESSGAAVALAAGKKVTLEIERYREANEGETWSAWHFDTARGIWVDTTTGTLGEAVAAGSDQIFSVVTVDIDSAGWWLAAKPVAATTCLRGAVKAPDGTVVAGADIRALGLFDLVASNAVADKTGAFCVDVKASPVAGGDAGDVTPTVELRGLSSAAAGVRFAGALQAAAGSTAASCSVDATACRDVGVVTLTPATLACVRSTVKMRVPDDAGEATETPLLETLPVHAQVGELLTGPQVRVGMTGSAYVGTLKPATGGAFCMPLPPASSYVVGGKTSPHCDAALFFTGSFSIEGVNALSTAGPGVGGACSAAAGDQDGGCATVPTVIVGCSD